MNNNIIPACIIGAGLFAVALKPAPQPAPIPQAEPASVATASVTGRGAVLLVWDYSYRQANTRDSNDSASSALLIRAWSDGTIEARTIINNFGPDWDICGVKEYSNPSDCPASLVWTSDWFVISSQMACRTDINGNGEIEFGDLLAVLTNGVTKQPARTLFSSNAVLACRLGERTLFNLAFRTKNTFGLRSLTNTIP